eukprot:XP_011667150.1 PREDICTED: neutral and basic amino acid transport protein rBAT [Strongylocentrotus purpuratus]
MDNNGFDNVEMKETMKDSETSKKAEAEGEVSHYSEVNDAEQGSSTSPQLCTRPYAGMGKEELLKFSQTPGWRAARWICLLIILAGWCAMLGMAIFLIITTPRCLPWWQSAVVYQIFPRSFADSAADVDSIIGGDGVGDLQGIINKVDYLKNDLGINAVLLSSIYKSGGRDNGEDITDFTLVDDVLGSIDDFEELVQVLHDNDIKLILDFIPNHSSAHHEFFQKSRKVVAGTPDSDDDLKYQEFYTWTDAPEPNNWISLYSGSAWNCDDVADKCFLHQYSEYQPDLDLANEEVRAHLSDALERWFTRGVDGFNIRGVRYFHEAPDFTDEPVNADYISIGSNHSQYESLHHDYTAEYDGMSHSLLQTWRDGVFYKFSTAGTYRVMLTDSDSNTTYVQSYYGTSNDPGANLPMNFNLLEMGDPMGQGGTITGRELEALIRKWLDVMDEGNWPNFQLGNYGASRIASRLAPEYSKVANILLLTLPGTPICYYGDELGMENLQDLEYEQGRISAPRLIHVWQLKTRDYERSPMQWDATMNAGFSTSEDYIYLPVHSNYQQVNVAAQKEDEDSVLQMFRRLVALRSEYRALTTDTINFVASSDEVIAYIREIDIEKERFFIALNFGSIDSEVDYFHTGDGDSLPLQGSVVVSTDRGRESSRVELNKLHLKPGEGVVVLLDEIVHVGSGWWYKFFLPDA